MRSLQQFWSMRRIGEARVTLVRLGPLRLWLARADKEWGFACEYGETNSIVDIAQVPEDVVPDALIWENMLFRDAPREFCLRPVVPDRPVVVKPEHVVSIPSGEAGLFYVKMPAFIQIVVVSGRNELILGTVPSRLMSDTWFGSPVEGDLCYSLPLPASMEADGLSTHPHHIVCPLEIQNRSDEVLLFEKLCLRPRYVGIYSGNTHLWSSIVKIQHEGLFKSAHVRYSGTQPENEPGLMLVTQPQKREEKGLNRLTFGYAFNKDIIFGR